MFTESNLLCLHSDNVLACRNLRRFNDQGYLMPTEGPATLSVPDGCTPVGSLRNMIFAVRGTEAVIVFRGSVVSSFDLEESPERVYICGNYLVAVMHGGWDMIIHIDFESRSLFVDDTQKRFRVSLNAPIIRFYDAGLFSADIESVALSKKWTESGTLSSNDRKNIAVTSRNALREIDDRVRRRGCLIHPMLVMARIRDARGRVVFESYPRLFRVPQANAAPMHIELTADSKAQATNPFTVSTHAYTMFLDADMRGWCEVYPGGTFEVVSSPVLPIFDTDSLPAVHGRQRADDSHLCSVTFPAGDSAYGDTLDELDVRNFLQLADDEHLPWNTLFSYRLNSIQFSGEVYLTGNNTVKASQLKRHSRESRYIYPSTPHRFTAATLAAAADTALWADISVHRASPEPIDHFIHTASSSAGIWHGYTAVEFADGAMVVSSKVADSGAPQSFVPLLSYPAPDAVAITLAWWSPVAGHFKQRFPLVPDGSGRRAGYIHPSGSPFALPRVADQFAVPQELDTKLRFPSRMVACDFSAPYLPLACADIPTGDIVALLPDTAPQQSWDFGRHRFRAFTSGGIYSVNVDRKRAEISLSLIDRRVLASPQHAVATPRGIAAVLGDSLILFSGNKSAVMATDVADRVPVWCDAEGGEIWLLGPDDTAVVPLSGKGIQFTIDRIFSPPDSGNLLRSADGWHVPGYDSPAAMVGVYWRGVIDVGAVPPGALRTLTFDAHGAFDHMNLTLTRSHLKRGAPGADIRLVFSGSLSSRYCRSFLSPPVGQYIATLDGRASPKSAFKSLSISNL